MTDRPLACCLLTLSLIYACLIFSGVPLPAAGALRQSEENLWKSFDGEVCRIDGTVQERGDKAGRAFCTVRKTALDGKKSSVKTVLYFNEKQTKQWGAYLLPGSRITAQGKVHCFTGPRNPGNFDAKNYYRSENMLASVSVLHVTDVSQEAGGAARLFYRLREGCRKNLIRALGEKNASMASSILRGDKSMMDPYLKSAWQKSGFAHVLAVSGLHMTFLGAGLFALLRKAGRGICTATVISLSVLVLYVLMTGGHVSAWRAFIMFAIWSGAAMWGRTYDPVTSFCTALFLVILTKPLSIFGFSFVYSFICAGALVFLRPFCVKGGRLTRGLSTSFCISGCLCPVTLYTTYEYPVYSFILNWLLLPLFPLFAGIALAGTILYGLWPAFGSIVLKPAGWMLTLFDRAVSFSLSLPFSRRVTGKMPVQTIALYFVLSALFLFAGSFAYEKILSGKTRVGAKRGKGKEKLKKEGRKGRAVFFTCFFLLYPLIWCLILSERQERNGRLSVTFLDVGQGDCTYMKLPGGEHIMIDGGSQNIMEAGREKITPFLLCSGVESIDYVFITHGDADHINGIESMIDHRETGVSIRRIILPEKKFWDRSMDRLAKKAQKKKIPVYEMREDDSIDFGECKIQCIGPVRELSKPGNESSLVLKVTCGSLDVLLTGDMEFEGEKAILSKGKDISCDILKVPHHGSKNISKRFFEKASPEVAVISAAKKNRFGHPAKETIAALKETGSVVCLTADRGAVSFDFDGAHLYMYTMLSD